MEAERLVEALGELQVRGWPVQVEHFMTSVLTGQSAGADVWLEGYRAPISISFDGSPLHWVNTALLTGFLVAQLEARGLRRDIEWEYFDDGWCCVVTVRGTDDEGESIEVQTLDHSTELEALIAVCHALAEQS